VLLDLKRESDQLPDLPQRNHHYSTLGAVAALLLS
jgi:hypothetical protein